MKEAKFSYKSIIEKSAKEVFAWLVRHGAFERVVPPWKKIKNLKQTSSSLKEGSSIEFLEKIGFFWKKWILQCRNVKKNQSYTQVQLQGPFAKYQEIRSVLPKGKERCELIDEITFISRFPRSTSWSKKQFDRTSRWCHELISWDLACFAKHRKKSLRILLTGSTGFVGSHLLPFLKAAGHEVVCLFRKKGEKQKNAIYWDPSSGEAEKNDFEDFDAVIHLAGKNLASGRWTKSLKQEIFLSRCRDTWLLSQILLRLLRPPKCLITASAVGFYGNRGEEELTEKSERGKGFLAEVCQKWEESTQAIENRGTRVVHTRFGLVVSPNGGFLEKLLKVYRLGLGGKIGDGNQIISWIALDDLLRATYLCLMEDTIEGAVNFTTPFPVSQKKFSELLAKQLHRPAFFSIPKVVIRTILGEMADEMILSSVKAIPSRLLEYNFSYQFPSLEEAFSKML
ncbi:MAG: TIGR01777 family oxidoreductase [Chlamydiae bacterium]|nr:TIGR01777 family oxidoreductase [Chlamydiota bacterium]